MVRKLEQNDFQQRLQQMEALLQATEEISDPAAQATTKALVQALLDLYGSGLERMLDIAYESARGGQPLIEEFARDELVSSLLLLHNLHPLGLEARVGQALNKVRPYLGSHGGNVELLEVNAAGLVRLRLQGSCHSCPSSAMTLKLAIEEALYQFAPDIAELVVEGVVERPPAPPANFVPISQLRGPSKSKPPAPINAGQWETVGNLSAFAPESVHSMRVDDVPVLFCLVNHTFYAYDPACPGCGQPLDEARLAGTALVCPTCGQHYDVIRAGRGLDQPNLNLEPYPLLEEHGQIKIALPVLQA